MPSTAAPTAQLVGDDLRERRFVITMPRARKPPKIYVAVRNRLDGEITLRTRSGRPISPTAYDRLVPIVTDAIERLDSAVIAFGTNR